MQDEDDKGDGSLQTCAEDFCDSGVSGNLHLILTVIRT